jgi:hypothetical protein
MTHKQRQPALRRMQRSGRGPSTDVQSVTKDDAAPSDLVQDYAQALMDVVVSDELLKHIPVIKTLTAAVAAVKSVRDQIL